MAAKRPSFQFYSADWLKDPAVRSVSLSARGLWIDMLCLMDQSSRRGYLQHATGKPVTAEQLARMTGCSTDDASRLLQELADSGVCCFTEHRIIYSKRMVNDEQKRQLCQEAGHKGGNPALMGKVKGQLTTGVKGEVNPEITPSSSSSLGRLEGEEIQFPTLNRVETTHLSSVAAICGIHRSLHTEQPALIPADEPTLRKIIGAAVRSLEIGSKPLEMFRGIVRKQTWENVTGDQRRKAITKLKEHMAWIETERQAGREPQEALLPLIHGNGQTT